jgi:hypothetical protein
VQLYERDLKIRLLSNFNRVSDLLWLMDQFEIDYGSRRLADAIVSLTEKVCEPGNQGRLVSLVASRIRG